MGQVECKRCSIGTFVSEKNHPGTSVSDCLACPYGRKAIMHISVRCCDIFNEKKLCLFQN